MLRKIAQELRKHAPFTAFGTFTGIVIMAALAHGGVSASVSDRLFWFFHPVHVLLSALVTAGVYRRHGGQGVAATLLVGYLGSVGIATLSDNLIPYAGEWMLRMPNRGLHLGFIEKWWLVNPLALLGSLLAFGKPRTQFPHAGHVLLSTWASLFHMTAAMGGGEIGATTIILIGVFLFLAVWLPCCTSDIVFPLVAVLAVSGPKARRKWLDADGAALVRGLGVQPGDRVLDFGCNWGAYAIPLAQRVGPGGEIVAVERNPKAIRALRRNLEKRAVRNIRIADDWAVVRGAAGARTFQAILLFDVLHMMPADERARLYADVREMLADDGRLAIHPKHTRENQPARHFSSCSEADVRAEIESAGFRLAERREVRLWHGHDQEAGCLLVFAKNPAPEAAPGAAEPTTP